MPTEKELDAAFAQSLVANPAFASWLVEQTRFKGRGGKCRSARSDHPWGKFPFESLNPATGKSESKLVERETDVLAIYQAEDGEVLGLHIENKLARSKFRSLQAESYAARAAYWVNNQNYGNYTSWETILVAPRSFYERHREASSAFGLFVPHEEVAGFIPLFRHPA